MEAKTKKRFNKDAEPKLIDIKDGVIGPKKCFKEDMLGGYCKKCSAVCEETEDCDECPIQEVFHKLAEYEDLGYTPEELKELIFSPEEMREVRVRLQEWQKYKELEKQGRLVTVPEG